jgi:hypothetical protein
MYLHIYPVHQLKRTIQSFILLHLHQTCPPITYGKSLFHLTYTYLPDWIKLKKAKENEFFPEVESYYCFSARIAALHCLAADTSLNSICTENEVLTTD